jgi:hypothetical protein
MQSLQWTNDANRYLLKNGEELLVDLIHQKAGNYVFFINNNRYTITSKGFWNPKYEVVQGEKMVLQLTYGIWRSKGKIIFADGSEYQFDYQSKEGIRFRFLDQEKEIMVFGIDYNNTQQLKVNFYVGIIMEDAEKLLLMSALGMSIFSSISKEMIAGNDIFSNTR